MKLLRILCIILLLVNALSAFVGGFGLLTDPSGQSMKLCLDCLQHSPFNDYFIPGIILFLTNGVSSFIVFGVVVIRNKFYPWLIIYQGSILVGWVIVQIIMLHTLYYLQFVFGGIGIILIIAGSIQTSHKNPLIKKQ